MPYILLKKFILVSLTMTYYDVVLDKYFPAYLFEW
jgi:hypothetical protein